MIGSFGMVTEGSAAFGAGARAGLVDAGDGTRRDRAAEQVEPGRRNCGRRRLEGQRHLMVAADGRQIGRPGGAGGDIGRAESAAGHGIAVRQHVNALHDGVIGAPRELDDNAARFDRLRAADHIHGLREGRRGGCRRQNNRRVLARSRASGGLGQRLIGAGECSRRDGNRRGVGWL